MNEEQEITLRINQIDQEVEIMLVVNGFLFINFELWWL